jgi:hypothetical protein
MAMPAMSWSATTVITDWRSSASRVAAPSGVSIGFDHASRSASGRGRLPAWVVRIESTLRFIRFLRSPAP